MSFRPAHPFHHFLFMARCVEAAAAFQKFDSFFCVIGLITTAIVRAIAAILSFPTSENPFEGQRRKRISFFSLSLSLSNSLCLSLSLHWRARTDIPLPYSAPPSLPPSRAAVALLLTCGVSLSLSLFPSRLSSTLRLICLWGQRLQRRRF
jgi:hypothetical protein